MFKFVKVLQSRFPNLKYVIKSRDKSKPSRGTLSILKANKLIGYKPQYNLKKGINKYLDFLIANNIFK